MVVYYKFKAFLDYDKIDFDGLYISVADLKKKIIARKKLAKTHSFHLKIKNAQTAKEYIEDSCRIPKNTYLIITRVPLALQTNGEQMDANNRKNAKHQANDINPRNCQKVHGLTRTDDVPTDLSAICQKMVGMKNCLLDVNHQNKPHTNVKRNAGISPFFTDEKCVGNSSATMTNNLPCVLKEQEIFLHNSVDLQAVNHHDATSSQPKSTVVTAIAFGEANASPNNSKSSHDESNGKLVRLPTSDKLTENTEANFESCSDNITADDGDNCADSDDDVIFVADFQSSNAIDVAINLPIQTLETIATEYNKIGETHTAIVVRPWMADGDWAHKPCIESINQFALYKCMMEKCFYATHSMESFQIHMQMHDQVIDYLKNKNSLDDQTHDMLINFRACAYCDFKAEANHQLTKHMENVHRRCIFQCPQCFYRTIEVDNMLLHRKMHHPNGENAILLCGDERAFQHQDNDILKNGDQNVMKIQCGQDYCTREFACYNSLYAHLNAEHSNQYTCPLCAQKMIRSKHTIIAHLSREHARFEEFQCLICVAGFNTIQAIREHMASKHPSNFLFVGARRTLKPYESTDQIQLMHVGESQEKSPQPLAKCSEPRALDAMKPTEMIPSRQLAALKRLNNEFTNLKTVSSEPAPRILGTTSLDIIKFDKYGMLIPLIVQYKCITADAIKHVVGIESYIDCATDVDLCTEHAISGGISSMLRHRCQKHSAQAIVFLQIEQRADIRVHKIVRCQFQCQRCHATFTTRSALIRHINNTHPNHWIAAIVLMETQIIESNEQKSSPFRSVDFFYSSALACIQSNCMRMIGTRTQAIEHHNEQHHHDVNAIDKFEFATGEKIIKNSPQEIASYVREVNETHQMHLFQCHHCSRLFESLANIQQHFADVRSTADGVEHKLRFSMRKLFRCREDNVIRTFAGMKLHYEDKHPRKQCTPVNVLLPELFCGLCDYNYKKNNDLNSHYSEKHACAGDSYSDALFKSLNLDKIDINQCKYALGCCCTIEEQNQLDRLVDHLMKCGRRFICTQCPDRTFSSAIPFVLHCMGHGTNANGIKIVENLQNIKTFLSLLQNMAITMPNGLVLTMAEIANTAFGQELSVQISQLAQAAWRRERDDLILMMVLNEQPQPLENETTVNTDVSFDTFERVMAPESANVEKPNDSSIDCNTHFDILYEPLSPNTDDILQALDEADSRATLNEVADGQLGSVKRSKRQATHDADVGGKRKKNVHEENDAPGLKTLECKSADGNADASQIEKLEEQNLQSDSSHIQCQESIGNAKKTKSDVVVESIRTLNPGSIDRHFGRAQCVRKIRWVSTITAKANDIKRIKKKRSPPQKKRGGQTLSIGRFIDTQLRKISNQKYRDKTERDVLRLLLDRIENEPVTESVVIQNGFSDGVAVREHPIKAERPADEIKNLGKNLSIELRKIARQELTQWQMLRLVVDCIENLPVTE